MSASRFKIWGIELYGTYVELRDPYHSIYRADT